DSSLLLLLWVIVASILHAAARQAGTRAQQSLDITTTVLRTMSINPKTLPRPTPETRHFWEGARRGELLLQQCESCAKVYFPPRPFCPECASRAVRVIRASGRAILYSYV